MQFNTRKEILLAQAFGLTEKDCGDPCTRGEIFLKKIAESGGTGGGASSWNDLTDKPFGEEIGVSDTLTWDGTADNTTVVPMEGFYLHPVTNQVPAMEHVVGSTIKYDLQGQEYSVEVTPSMVQPMMDGLYGITTSDNLDSPGGTIYVATADNVNMEGIVFPKKGMYFMAMTQMALVTKSITVPNFEFTTTVVKKIDPKYLPDFTLTAPNGTKYALAVADDGTLSAVAVE